MGSWVAKNSVCLNSSSWSDIHYPWDLRGPRAHDTEHVSPKWRRNPAQDRARGPGNQGIGSRLAATQHPDPPSRGSEGTPPAGPAQSNRHPRHPARAEIQNPPAGSSSTPKKRETTTVTTYTFFLAPFLPPFVRRLFLPTAMVLLREPERRKYNSRENLGVRGRRARYVTWPSFFRPQESRGNRKRLQPRGAPSRVRRPCSTPLVAPVAWK